MEVKLFFIETHFDLMPIEMLNQMVDIFIEITDRKDIKYNPILSQFNTIKVSLLIYRMTWLIKQRKINSLTAKCQIINSYIVSSLNNYLS